MNLKENLQEKKILILDDTPTMRVIVTGMLQDIGFSQIFEAENVEGAKEQVGKERIDLVLCDWNIPGQTGLDFLKWVRAHHRDKDLPIVMMTSNNDPVQIIEARAAGATNYLVKPFGMVDLAARIEESLIEHS